MPSTFEDAMQYAAKGIDNYSTEELGAIAEILGSSDDEIEVSRSLYWAGYSGFVQFLALTTIAAELETRHAL